PLLHLHAPPVDVWSDHRGMTNRPHAREAETTVGRRRSPRLRVCTGLALTCMLVGALAPARSEDGGDPSAAALIGALLENRGPIGAPFDLLDHSGRRRTDADFRGK